MSQGSEHPGHRAMSTAVARAGSAYGGAGGKEVLMADQKPEQNDSDQRWQRARVIATFADAVARIAELFLRR